MTTIRMTRHSQFDHVDSAPPTSVIVVFKDKTHRLAFPELDEVVNGRVRRAEHDCSFPLHGLLHRYDIEAGTIVVLTGVFGLDNGILLRFDRCSSILVSPAESEKWIDLIQKRQAILGRIQRGREEAERAAHEKEQLRVARAKAKGEEKAREAAHRAELDAARQRAVERERERERDTEIEASLRLVAGEKTVFVALTDAERAQIRHASIAKLIGPQRDECYYRLVWPGLSVSQFALGPAPAGRPQYAVRFFPRVEPSSYDGVLPRGIGRGGVSPDLYRLRLPTPRAVWDRTWDPCPDVAPPEYPYTTPYQHARSNILGKQHIRSLSQTDASAEYATRKRATADRRSLAWQIDNTKRAARAELLRREQAAQEAVARMTGTAKGTLE